jgi:hypothetical protein
MTKKQKPTELDLKFIEQKIEEIRNKTELIGSFLIKNAFIINSTGLSKEEKRERLKDLLWIFNIYIFYDLYNDLVLLCVFHNNEKFKFRELITSD